MVLWYCYLLLPFGLYRLNSLPSWHQILCDNSPLDIREEGLPHYLYKVQNQSSHFPSPVISTPTIVHYHFICKVLLSPWLTLVSLIHICDCESNTFTSLLRWFYSFFSSHVGPTMQMQVPEIFLFFDNIQLAATGRIILHILCSPMLLSHISTESESSRLW